MIDIIDSLIFLWTKIRFPYFSVNDFWIVTLMKTFIIYDRELIFSLSTSSGNGQNNNKISIKIGTTAFILKLSEVYYV